MEEYTARKTDIAGPFIVNSPYDNYGHIDGSCGKRRQVFDKAWYLFLDNISADYAHKIGLDKWEETPIGRILKIAEGEDIFLKENY